MWGLCALYRTAVVHQIREQITAHQKTIFLSGGVAGLMADEELRTSVLPSLASGARSLEQVGAFTPLLNYVSDSEIERGEREREKEIVRRRKRGNRARRGVAMPEREPQRTFRTPGIGFAPVDPANLTAQAILNAPTSRRAAAAAAQINIANMVASENRPEDMDPSSSPITAATMSLPQTSAPTAKAPKEPQPKGLFKAPEYPPSVLRPRAAAKAPTPSNAFERGYLLPDAVLDHAPPPAMSSRPPDSRADRERPDSVRRAREAERDAKEQEFKESQHPNYIDGVWHCTNCGCPDNLAVGRRKGPMGEKTQCGICGKYWHRHRKPRPIEYHAEAEYHQGLKDDAARQKAAAARKKSGRPPLAALMEKEESMGSDAKGETPRRVSSRSITRVQSPVTSDDSGDEAPLAAQQGRTNGSRPSPSEGVSTPDVSQGVRRLRASARDTC
jgi:SWI/SNF-related matrix-associated actin-dependent regulator of chromatin subfamily B protein 1